MAANNTSKLVTEYCYRASKISAGGMFHGSNSPFAYAMPTLLCQIILVVATTRGLAFLLKPLRQPKVVAEILAGMLLGPSGLGKVHLWFDRRDLGAIIFPEKSFRQLDTLAYIGLLFFLFLIGVEFDLKLVTRMRKKVITVATANMLLPFAVTILVALIMNLQAPPNVYHLTYVFFIGAAMAVTAFPVLVRILADLKLLNNELGQLVLPSAILADLMAWIFLVITTILPARSTDPLIAAQELRGLTKLVSLWILLVGSAFALACWLLVRPAIRWIMRRTPEGQPVSDTFISIVTVGALAAGIVSDAIGFHAVFGAFVFGMMVPHGPLAFGLRDKLEGFVVGVLLPVFFASSGFKTNLSLITVGNSAEVNVLISLVLVLLITLATKVACSVLIAQYYSMPASQGLSLGLLMSVKGPIEMIILNIGRQKRVFDMQTYTILVLGSVVTTSCIAPAVALLSKTSRNRVAYKRRNLQKSHPDMELRLLACVHSARNVPSIISLLQLTNPTNRCPIFLYAVRLIELTGSASAMLIVHDNDKKRDKRQSVAGGAAAVQSDQIISTFANYEQQAGGVSVQSLTAVSPYSTMHEDIFNITEERHAMLIILPFHKVQSVAGDLEELNPAIRNVNKSILASPPCSVAVLVDRGLSRSDRPYVLSQQQQAHNVAVLYFGGPDDREALAFAGRMASHPWINLHVVRFISSDEAFMRPSPSHSESAAMTSIAEASMQRQLDDECMNEFRLRHLSDGTVVYTEKVVRNTEDTVAAVRAMSSMHSMYVVGRGKGMESSPLLSGLMEWSEYPELGIIGDMLVSPDFGTNVSVLVVQQYVSAEGGGQMEVPAPLSESPAFQPVQAYLNNANHWERTAGFNSGWTGAVN